MACLSDCEVGDGLLVLAVLEEILQARHGRRRLGGHQIVEPVKMTAQSTYLSRVASNPLLVQLAVLFKSKVKRLPSLLLQKAIEEQSNSRLKESFSPTLLFGKTPLTKDSLTLKQVGIVQDESVVGFLARDTRALIESAGLLRFQ